MTWIPCTAELPSSSRPVLVTVDGKSAKRMRVVTVATLQGEVPHVYFRSFFQGRMMAAMGHGDYSLPIVVAWCDMPEPYDE